MQLNYQSTETDQSYAGRIFMFVRRNIWLFLLDFLTLIFLIIPPYSWQETQLIILLLFVLLIRDIFIFRLAYNHMGQFVAKGNNVIIRYIKGSKLTDEMEEWLPDMDLEIRYTLGFPVLYILKENGIIFKQYPFGDWNGERMREFIESFYDYKKEQNLWKIYKGQE